MALVTLARPARSVSSIGLLGLWLVACQADVPQPTVRRDDPALRPNGPLLLWGKTPFTGRVLALYPNGDTLSVEPFRNGKLHGTAVTWYPNGRKAEARSYDSGRRVGVHEGWWENGRRRFRHAYADDWMEGVSESWYPDGRLAQRRHYARGREAGRQTLWQPDGTLLANYEVRHGRNYGLTGQNPCANAPARVSF
jgi:hypothetical protein